MIPPTNPTPAPAAAKTITVTVDGTTGSTEIADWEERHLCGAHGYIPGMGHCPRCEADKRAEADARRKIRERAVLNPAPAAATDVDEVERLKADIERLRQYEPRIMPSSSLRDTSIACAKGFLAHLVQSFDALNGNANYSVTEVSTYGGNKYEVTVRRKDKPTPHELRKKAEAERDALRKAVDALPKTADGVPIVPGMTLYVATGAGSYVCEMRTFIRHEFDGVTPNIEGIIGGNRTTSFPATRCYTTREGAEAALALATGDGAGEAKA